MIGMTVCSGIGAPELSSPWIDWRFQAEIAAFPATVLRHRFPGIQNLGDITKFREWPDAEIDILCGGTPCQSFSLSGLRGGLDDPRGSLMLAYLGVARRYRPRWLVWENVGGVLSSNGGRDFGTLLRGMAELGYGWAYRRLDAQHVKKRDYPRGLPQQRRRVFLVGYIGIWSRAGAALFDADSLSGSAPPCREEEEGLSGAPLQGSREWREWPAPKAPTLNAAFATRHGLEYQHAFSGAGLFVPAPPLEDGGPESVRRLTPIECHRIMGFPDHWCCVPWNGRRAENCPAGPQYEALGNSWAINCGQWLFDNIRRVESIT